MESETLQGQLLISSARMLDPNFAHTVILLVQAGEEGALGLVLNRPLEITVKEACAQVLESPCNVEAPLLKGGPCEGPLMAVHSFRSASDVQVVNGVYLTTERHKIEELLREGVPHAKFFVGYSGWSAGQLEMEIETGSWVAAPADAERIFDDDPEQWARLMAELTAGQPIKRNQMPSDPSLN